MKKIYSSNIYPTSQRETTACAKIIEYFSFLFLTLRSVERATQVKKVFSYFFQIELTSDSF